MKKIFKSLPASVQNIIVTAYGYNQTKIRYKSSFGSPFEKVYADEIEGNNTLRDELVKTIVGYAVKNVPYYRDVFNADKFTIEKFTANDIPSAFPIVDKKIIQTRLDEFISDEYDKTKLIEMRTSGTTGTPGRFYCNETERARNYFFFRRVLNAAGADYNTKSCTIAARPIGGLGLNQIGNYDYYNNTMYLSSFRFSKSTIKYYMEWLNKYQPEYLDSFPSSIFSIITLAKEQGLKLNFRLKFILLSSETILDYHRSAIKDFFNDPIIVDQYGSVEMVANLWRLDEGPFNVDNLYCVPEFSSTQSDQAQLVATSLIKQAMPLIRYNTGDEMILNGEQEIIGIAGRHEDVIITPSGVRVQRLDSTFKGIDGINEAQIIQTSKNTVTIKVSASDEYTQKGEQVLKANAAEYLLNEMAVTIEYVDKIARTKSGKFKAVISLKE